MQKINNQFYDLYGDRWYTAFDDPVALLRAESKTKTPWVVARIAIHFRCDNTTKVLDVGCGAGFLSNALALQQLAVTGVDLSSESLRVAAAHDGTKSVTYKKADAYQLPFADESFHVVTAMDFLEHIERPEEVIKEISRVLKPNGLFIFHTFNRNPLAYVVVIKLVEFFVKNTPKDMHILRLFIKPKELVDYCEKAQLKTESLVGIKPVIASLKLKSFFTGVVPEGLKFELTKSLLLSYMGCSVKSHSK